MKPIPRFRFSITAGVMAFGLLLVFIPVGGGLYLRYGDYYMTTSHGVQNAEMARWLAGRIEWDGVAPADIASPGSSGAFPTPFAWQRVFIYLGEAEPPVDSLWIEGATSGLESGLPFSRRAEDAGGDEPSGPPSETLAAIAKNAASIGRRSSGNLPEGLLFSAAPFSMSGMDGGSASGALLFISDRSGIRAYKASLTRLTLALSAASLGLALALGGAFHFLFTRPLKRLRAEAARLVQSAPEAELTMPGRLRLDEIGDLARSFESSFQALFDRNAAIDAFASDVLHELKNPLAGARNALELLLRRSVPSSDGDTERLLTLALREACRTESLLYSIKELGALERREETGGSVDLKAIAVEIGEYYGLRTTRGTCARVLVDASTLPDGIRTPLSAERLGRALRNLIDNALDFSPPGGSILVSFVCVDGGTEILVADEGKGIPETELPRIFDRFYSTRKADPGAPSHSGLGLAIARSIAEAAGGSLAYRPNERRGSIFVLRIPLSDRGCRFSPPIPTMAPDR